MPSIRSSHFRPLEKYHKIIADLVLAPIGEGNILEKEQELAKRVGMAALSVLGYFVLSSWALVGLIRWVFNPHLRHGSIRPREPHRTRIPDGGAVRGESTSSLEQSQVKIQGPISPYLTRHPLNPHCSE